MKNLLSQLFRYGLVGLAGTAISLGIYNVFIFINKDWYLLGNGVGWLCSVVVSCALNRRFVFQNGEHPFIIVLLKSYLAYGASVLLSMGLLYLQIEKLHVRETIAPLLNIFVTVPLNYFISKRWTFR